MLSFLDQLKEAIEEGKRKREEQAKNPPTPGSQRKLTIKDKLSSLKGAFLRAKASGIFNPSTYCGLDEASERLICCSTCTEGMTCPYCGCVIQGKRFLKTENCPSKETYPNIPKFPSRNYWKVCNQRTTSFIVYQGEGDLDKTISGLLSNATGDVEVVIGLNGCDANTPKDDKVKVAKSSEVLPRREFINALIPVATGTYFFMCDPRLKVEQGWDTKLKCACDSMSIATASIKDEADGQVTYTFKTDFSFEWKPWPDAIVPDPKPILMPVLLFNPGAWMIQKDVFLRYGGFDETLEYDTENIEWMLKLVLRGGQIICRTDLNLSMPATHQHAVPPSIQRFFSFIDIIKGNNECVKNLEEVFKDFEKFSKA